jgi:pimeloyl-ACP methyl ester carboxylesterase
MISGPVRDCSRPALVGLALVITVSGCSLVRQQASRYPAADVKGIYATARANPERNPIILIHGFTGAKIVRTADGASVWGAFFTEDAPLPSSPDGLRAMALDIDGLLSPIRSQDLLLIKDDSHASELLEKAHAGAVVGKVSFGIYADMVNMVESAGYAPCRHVDQPAQSSASPACFTFFYDWRQDNVGNAIALGRFIDEAKRQVAADRTQNGSQRTDPVRFDVLAHSMGGLITRYYLRYGAKDVLGGPNPAITWAGAENISRAILIATPNFGAMQALKELITGVKYPVVKYEQSLLATYVSLYQMLPREDHALWFGGTDAPQPYAYMRADLWQGNRWGPFEENQDRYLETLFPDAATKAERAARMAEFMDAAFERGRRFMAALDRHPATPSPIPLILFAADASPTLAKAVIAKDENGRVVLRFKPGKKLDAPGDGRVTRASALADERAVSDLRGWMSSPILWSQTFFLTDSHTSMFGNPTFQNNLLHLLLDQPP